MAIQPDALSMAFAALADPTRRAILARLSRGDADVTELMKPFALNQSTISKHLKVLEHAGLIARGRDAQRRPRTLVAGPLEDIDAWLDGYRKLWEDRFTTLDDHLTETSSPAKARRRAATPRRNP